MMNIKRGLTYFIVFDVIFAIVLISDFSYQSKNNGASMFSPVKQWWTQINQPKEKQKIAIENAINQNQLEQNSVGQKPLSSVITIPKKEEVIVLTETNTQKDNIAPMKDMAAMVSTQIATQNEEVKTQLVEQNNPEHEVHMINGIKQPIIKTEKKQAAICVNYGPLNIEQKASLDVILTQNKVPPSSYIATKEPLYEISWNLGANKVQAIELFEAQKNDGPLQDEKFKLKQDLQGNWFVPVSTIAGDAAMAKKMVGELESSATGLGGKWEYKEKSDGYFYQFKDIGSMPVKTVDTMNQTINVLKTPCESH